MSKPPEIRIKNVPKTQHDQLSNIHLHTGLSVPALLKSNLHRIIESYPESYTKPPRQD